MKRACVRGCEWHNAAVHLCKCGSFREAEKGLKNCRRTKNWSLKTNEFVGNEFHSLTSCRQGLWICGGWAIWGDIVCHSFHYCPSSWSAKTIKAVFHCGSVWIIWMMKTHLCVDRSLSEHLCVCACVCAASLQQSRLLSALKTNWCPRANIRWFI